MNTFTYACLRSPGPEIVNGLSQTPKGIPRLPIILAQYQNYVQTLREASLSLTILPSDPRFPDGPFVEDTHLILPELVVRLNPGAPSRREEPGTLHPSLPQDRPWAHLNHSHSMDGGDILRVGKNIFVGESSRTSLAAIRELEEILSPFSYQILPLKIQDGLHLKSSLTALDPTTYVLYPPAFDSLAIRTLEGLGQLFNLEEREKEAANCLPLNGHLLLGPQSPRLADFVRKERPHLTVKTLDMSEFAKIDGALTCLSLRW